MESKHKPKGPYERFFKRPIDFCCGMAAILVFWWLYIIIVILVRVKLGSPVLFVQERPGKDEKIFKLYKFRTMTDERDENGELLPDDQRITKFGKMLRATSLDEMPEAFNLINGTLSVVGPRPLLKEYIPYYTEEEHHRHDIRPGLTGLAQVNGRNAIEWEDKFTYDLQYIEECSFVLDIIILFKTVEKVITHSGIQVGSEVKAGRFDDHRRKQIEERQRNESTLNV